MKGVTIFIVVLSNLISNFVVCDDLENDKIITMHLETADQEKSLIDYCKRQKIEIVVGPSLHMPTSVLVSPDKLPGFVTFVEEQNIAHKVGNKKIKELLAEEEVSNVKAATKNMFRGSGTIVGTFARHNDINKWMIKLSRRNRICSVVNIGYSYEIRPMLMLKISTGQNRPIIFMDAGIHAREWLSTATLVYIMDALVQDYNRNDPTAVELLSKYDLYFLPSANPDGYEYTFKDSSTRLWRKTRRPNGNCYGSDPNRNFDIAFGTTGVEDDPCDPQLYPGPYAFSEVETQNFANFVWPRRQQIKMYFSLHAYSQIWFTPYAYENESPSDIEELTRVANIGANALFKVHGKNFTVGSPPELMYRASGSSMDWMKAKAGVKYAYAFEIRPGGNEYGGFMQPATEIIPSGEEVYAGIKAAALAMKD